MQERGLIGLEARAADGTEIGRIAEVVTDEESGEVTHVVVETEDGGRRLEVPITASPSIPTPTSPPSRPTLLT